MNIENILEEGIKTLQKSKISNPQLDSEILLSSSIKKDKKHIILRSNRICTKTTKKIIPRNYIM